jgi:hypothetical protein
VVEVLAHALGVNIKALRNIGNGAERAGRHQKQSWKCPPLHLRSADEGDATMRIVSAI